jgi:prevent-host-death family protein
VKRISIAKAKKELSSVVADVERGAERYVLEDDGRPVAAVVSLEDLERLQETAGQGAKSEVRRGGLLAFQGLFEGVMTDAEVDEFIRDVYRAREGDSGPPAPDFGDWRRKA